jgi:hypothetical protein
MSALKAPALQHIPPIGRLHPNAEAVCLLAVAVVGLIGTLHVELRIYSGRKIIPETRPLHTGRSRRILGSLRRRRPDCPASLR